MCIQAQLLEKVVVFVLQLSPVAQQMQPSQPSHTHAVQAGGSCSGGGVGGSGNRRRRTVEQDPDERRQKFLERNRAAATRCRQKRKLWVSSLEKKAEELTHTNLQLQVGCALSTRHTHTNTTYTSRVLTISLCLLPERGDVTEVGGGSAEADSAHPQGLSCHCSAEGGTGVPQ